MGYALRRKDSKRWYITVRFGPPLFRRDFSSSTLLLRTVEESVHAFSQAQLDVVQ